MNKRKLTVALTTGAVATAGFGAAVLPASAEHRSFRVKLLDGSFVTVRADSPTDLPLPPGTYDPASVVEVPSVPSAPVPEVQVPGQEPTPAPAKPSPSGQQGDNDSGEPKPRPSGGGGPQDEPKAGSGGGRQPTTGKARRDAVDERPGKAGGKERERARKKRERTRLREPDGAPAVTNPGLSLATPGAAPIGVPNFFIDKFRIPPFLLSIYQAAGIEYGIRWEVLAAINEIETDYGRNLNVSSAGALGWMQFMPATWKAYGVDANGDKKKDPYNPVDAIFAAARYLKAAGAEEDLPKAIFAYNHADWYVDSVLMRARLIGGIPANLVGSLTGLTQGLFPVHATARYADDLTEREVTRRVAKGRSAAVPVEADERRRSVDIYAKPGSPAVAVQDGRIVKIGRSKRLGRFIQVRDAYGNTYTYGDLKTLAERHPVPKTRKVDSEQIRRELKLPPRDPKPDAAASAGSQPEKTAAVPSQRRVNKETGLPVSRKERLFANPKRPEAFEAGGEEQLLDAGAGFTTFKAYFTQKVDLDPKDVRLKKLDVGSKVVAGTILGRLGRTSKRKASHLRFEIRPAGRGAPRIDPKPILDGWKLLESTAIYRAKGKNPFFGADAKTPTIGQILLMSKETLQRRVLANPRIDVYGIGRTDIRAGRIDRRVLSLLEFLSANGLRPTVTSLYRPGAITVSGNVSQHSSGNAVDIAAVNGIPMMGNQGKGSITDITIRRMLTLQGTMKADQIISLMSYDGADNTYAMGDHADHIHVGFQPMWGTNSKLGRQMNSVLKPGQWIKLVDRLGEIDNPTVRVKPSKYAITVKPGRASSAHRGE